MAHGLKLLEPRNRSEFVALRQRLQPSTARLYARSHLLLLLPSLQDHAFCSQDEFGAGVNKTDSAKRNERAGLVGRAGGFAGVAGVAHSADDLSDLLTYKLSPKVFGHKAAPAHSLEDLTMSGAARRGVSLPATVDTTRRITRITHSR